MSDVHADTPLNMEWIVNLPEHPDDALIVPGMCARGPDASSVEKNTRARTHAQSKCTHAPTPNRADAQATLSHHPLPTALGPAGDICTDLFRLRKVLKMLNEKFAVVFFTPGNHELWSDMYVTCVYEPWSIRIHVCTSRGSVQIPVIGQGTHTTPNRNLCSTCPNSLDKFLLMLNVCDDLGVRTSATFLGEKVKNIHQT